MKLILLSGGSGKRLWPLSNDSRSKQFLKLLSNPSGQGESMVQRVWRQLKAVQLLDSTYVAVGKTQLDIMHNQIGQNLTLIVEPEKRDTFPAIALAASYLYDVEKVKENDVLCVVPVDPFVEEDFFLRLKELEKIVTETNAELVLMGVKPLFPTDKYGYIVPDCQISEEKEYAYVQQFIEKPQADQAKQLLEQNALWNCGVFAFRLGYLLTLLEEKGLPKKYELLLARYDELPKRSFDYEVVEKSKDMIVLPYHGIWKDLGTWNTLTEELNEYILGKGLICENSKNTHLINELDLPVAVVGLSNVVVAVSPDGILVADKTASSKVKDLVPSLQQRPMYEERRWGWYRVLEYIRLADGNEVLTKRIGVMKGKNLSYQLHHKRSEVWTIIFGEGEFILNDHIQHVRAGDVLQIPIGAKHGIKAITDLEFIEIQTGRELIEEDIVRIFMSWEEALKHCSS